MIGLSQDRTLLYEIRGCSAGISSSSLNELFLIVIVMETRMTVVLILFMMILILRTTYQLHITTLYEETPTLGSLLLGLPTLGLVGLAW